MSGELTDRGKPRQRVKRGASHATRILFHTDRSGECWIWTACLDRTSGYGRVTIKGKTLYSHRLAYETFVGPIPDGLDLDHLCRVRACCNPAHLEPVTARVNMLRGMSVGAVAQRRDFCNHGMHDYATHGVTYKDGRRHCRECDRIRARLWQALTPSERAERKAAGLPVVDLAAHYARLEAAA